jgi:hypothetical protein
LKLSVGRPGLHLVDQTPHRLSEAAVHREMNIAFGCGSFETTPRVQLCDG